MTQDPADPREPIERSLFETPPMIEQERMVEAVLFVTLLGRRKGDA